VEGLFSSTLLDFFVHAALFWIFGRRVAQHLTEDRSEQIALVEEKPQP
jgi:HME family heavy-metal exporter